MSEQATRGLERLLARQESTAAWKVALNVPAVQQRLGLTHALAAPIESLRQHASGTRLTVGSERAIHVEAELALRLGADIDHDVEEERELAGKIESVAPCLELVDYALPRSGLEDMFAHTFFHAGVVLGSALPLSSLQPLGEATPCASDGARTHARLPGLVPDDLLDALRGVLARAREVGATLKRGQLVLCGSYIQPMELAVGSTVRVDYGAQLGVLTISR